ncbi:MAG: glutathione binding-like protein, partial [Myxococcota bacterium]
KRLADNQFLAGDEYSIADIVNYPWYGVLARGKLYDAGEFLDVQSYTHLQRWTEEIGARPAVRRGRRVNRVWGEESAQLRERHSAADFGEM